jgi:hypothetical protein
MALRLTEPPWENISELPMTAPEDSGVMPSDHRSRDVGGDVVASGISLHCKDPQRPAWICLRCRLELEESSALAMAVPMPRSFRPDIAQIDRSWLEQCRMRILVPDETGPAGNCC